MSSSIVNVWAVAASLAVHTAALSWAYSIHEPQGPAKSHAAYRVHLVLVTPDSAEAAQAAIARTDGVETPEGLSRNPPRSSIPSAPGPKRTPAVTHSQALSASIASSRADSPAALASPPESGADRLDREDPRTAPPGQAANTALEPEPTATSGANVREGDWDTADPAAVISSVRQGIDATKRYPRLARQAGLEGQTVLQFRLLHTGDIKDLRVVRSSGYPILDEAAMGAVRRAAPFPEQGGLLSGRFLDVTVPIVFRLH